MAQIQCSQVSLVLAVAAAVPMAPGSRMALSAVLAVVVDFRRPRDQVLLAQRDKEMPAAMPATTAAVPTATVAVVVRAPPVMIPPPMIAAAMAVRVWLLASLGLA